MESFMLLDKGAPGVERPSENRVNSANAKSVEPKYCKVCQSTLQHKEKLYCSRECKHLDAPRKVERPDRSQLESDISNMSFLAIGRKYGVSDNAVRKWAKQYGIDMQTLSQARRTRLEGSETTGGV